MPDTGTSRLQLLRGVVHPWHHDIFGHMNVRHYAPFFDDATFHLYSALGVGIQQVLDEFGVHIVTAKAETNFLRELTAGDIFLIDGAVVRLGTKSCTHQLRMIHVETGAVHATYDLTEVFFDPETRRSAPMPQAVRQKMERFLV
ncbi:MAG: acyl-CoA thioester hydrolase [Rhodobacteraceae bacterium HLUCCA12]|nr:MAG: acyl-CoA thioester hydrolase [Rhodobacteraceae bacterium HLUCCA12]